MTDPRVAQVQQTLVTTAGGFLRNPLRAGTCSHCFTPTASQPLCARCRHLLSFDGGPDLLGMVAYAGYLDPITQSGHVMRGYKNPYIQSGFHRQTVALMSALGLIGHVACPGALTGFPITAWATVPSLPPKPDLPKHALNDIVGKLARPGSAEVTLTAATAVSHPRDINPSHYTASANAAGQHVLVIDDTWTSGGHATSAALAIRAAGAIHVSVLVLARWLANSWELTTPQWAKQHLAQPDFDPDVCPWTQGPCP